VRAKVFYVPSWVLPWGFDGLALKWVILISRSRRLDMGLEKHERVHIAQQERAGFRRYMWQYLTDASYRALMEAQAFREGSGFDYERIQRILVNNYHVSHDTAKMATTIIKHKEETT
jgi:hypothetical protein